MTKIEELSLKDATERHAQLVEIINQYRYEYHVNDNSIMSEAAADQLKHELSLIEEQFPKLITPDSPSQRVAGKPSDGFQKVTHSSRMLSLNDVFSIDEVQNWLTRIDKVVAGSKDAELFIDLKYDGLAISLIYQDGILVQALTRGDGKVGEDVTENIRTIESIPLKLNTEARGELTIRGEVVIYKDDLIKLNQIRQKNGEDLYKNPRNLAAGTIRQLDSSLVAKRPLKFHAYDLIESSPHPTSPVPVEGQLTPPLNLPRSEGGAAHAVRKVEDSFRLEALSSRGDVIWENYKQLSRDNRNNPTEAENALWQMLRKDQLGIKFRRQHVIAGYIVDFWAKESNLIIEVDGDYHLSKEQKEYDQARSDTLQALNQTIIRFTNDQVLNDPQEVIEKILAAASSPERGGQVESLIQPGGAEAQTSPHPTSPVPREGQLTPPPILPREGAEPQTHSETYAKLKSLGFKINPMAGAIKFNQIAKFLDKWEVERESLPFQTDGAVIKVNSRDLYQRLGVVGKAPRGAVAFKFPAEEAVAIIEDIVISIGRTGAATPVAVFEPVQLAGTTVKHASLHNADEIERKDIRIGDTVIVYKAGDIIPQVLKVLTDLRPQNSSKFNFEDELKRQFPELKFSRPEGEAVYRVQNYKGEIILKKSLEHYASRQALDIESLGEKNVEALVDANLVHDIADIYSLKFSDIEPLERFAKLSTQNLIQAIEDSKAPELSRFIFGLGIRHVGIQTAIDLAKNFGSIDALSGASFDELSLIDGIGLKVAESILAWFSDEDNQNLITKFNQAGVKPWHQDASGPLVGKSFVITGSLSSMSRDEAADKIRALGGTFQTSVGKGTTYLVAGGKVGASKLNKAEKFGTEVIDEPKFLNLINSIN